MLKNYITDNELKLYHPRLNSQLWANQASFAGQIAQAFDIVWTDLNNKELSPRLLMTPLALAGTSGDSTTSLTTSLTGSGVEADRNYNRLVINPTEVSGTWTIAVQGSDNNVNFYEVGSVTSSVLGINTATFNSHYKYWRFVATEVASGSITTPIQLVETIFDKLIIYKAFILIFSDFRKVQNDSWDLLVQDYMRRYDNEMMAVKYTYDADDSQTIEDGEVAQNIYRLTL